MKAAIAAHINTALRLSGQFKSAKDQEKIYPKLKRRITRAEDSEENETRDKVPETRDVMTGGKDAPEK